MMGGFWTGIVTHWNLIWFDVCCLMTLTLLLVIVFKLPQLQPSYRVVPMWPSPDHTMLYGPREFSYPYFEPFIPSWACALIATLFPALVICGFQISVRSWWDVYCGVFGNLKAVVFASIVQICLKQAVGGFRPSYLTLCEPDMARYRSQIFVNGIYFANRSVCTGDPGMIDWALQSFPSGHSSAGFAAALFLSLYINAKLKTFADFASNCWSIFFTIAPLVTASSLAGGLWLAHTHHPVDIIFGIIIGVLAGIISYRSSYASLLDFRFNHIPLPPASAHMRFSYNYSLIVEGHSQNGMGTTAQFANRLVGIDWWRKTASRVDSETRRWMRSVNSLRATGVEMKHANLKKNMENSRESSLEDAMGQQLEEMRMTGAVDSISETDQATVEAMSNSSVALHSP